MLSPSIEAVLTISFAQERTVLIVDRDLVHRLLAARLQSRGFLERITQINYSILDLTVSEFCISLSLSLS